MVKNLPGKAGDRGSIPGGGTRILHATGHLSPCSAATEVSTPPRKPEHCHKTQRGQKAREKQKKLEKLKAKAEGKALPEKVGIKKSVKK